MAVKKSHRAVGEPPGLFGAAAPITRPEPPPPNRRPAEKTAADYVADAEELIRSGINSPHEADAAQFRWAAGKIERLKLDVPSKDERLLKAALDGRCNRVRAGFAPTGRD